MPGGVGADSDSDIEGKAHFIKADLPNYASIAPDLIHDTRNAAVSIGDEYLSGLIPTILESRQYRNGSTVLFFSWDESEGVGTEECAYNTTNVGCHPCV